MSTMRFINGPAQGQTIEISVEPRWTRWFCELQEQDGASPRRLGWWWVTHGAPPEDEQVNVTRYDVVGTMPDPENEGETIYTFGIKDQEALSG